MQVHEFAIMHDHLHLLITPAPDQSLEKCVQFVKGGFSFRLKKELGYKWEVWQKSFNEHQVKDAEDYWNHVHYIHQNPVVARYVSGANEYEFSSARRRVELDRCPEHLRG